jgi:mannose-1-phosphate guanylyltransferase
MKKTSRAAVVEGRFRWSDIGSWDAVYAVSERNGSGNALHCLLHACEKLPEGRLTGPTTRRALQWIENAAIARPSDRHDSVLPP